MERTMDRRTFVLDAVACAVAGSFFCAATSAVAQAENMDPVTEIKKLRINAGRFTGGYLVAPLGALNWYFANLGLLPMVQHLNAAELEFFIRPYLDLYLQQLEPDYSIQDVNFDDGIPTADFQLVLSDSDDSYAATFLSLAAGYVEASQNWTWWDTNKAALKNMAYQNLACAAKPGGLISVFQAPRSAVNSLGYLMDNSEAYRGLRDYASVLLDRGETDDANYYDALASAIATALSTALFDTAAGGFRVSDGDAHATTLFYAGTTCQVFPEAFDVTELSSYFDKGWRYLNLHTPSWEDGRYDPYPWAVLGFVAAKRGQTAQAQAQLRMIATKFTTSRHLVTINELGFCLRISSALAGLADV